MNATRLLLVLSLLAPLSGQRLPTGWRIAPAGELVSLDTFPFRAIQVPGDPDRVLVLHSGFRPPSISLARLSTRKVEKSLRLPDAGHGWALRGRELYVAGGHASAVYVTDVDLSPVRTLPVEWPGGRFPRSYVTDVAVSAAGDELFVTEQQQDSLAVLNSKTGKLLRRFTAGVRPARVLVDGNRILVASAGDHRVLALDRSNGRVLHEAQVAANPADLLLAGATLFVAGAGSNYVDALDAQTLRPRERLNLALAPKLPYQMTPSHLALDQKSGMLFVTCSDANAVAVVDIRQKSMEVEGFIPAGWYPTATLPLGSHTLLVLNGKGSGSSPNPAGPNPTIHRTMTPQPPSDIQYIPLVQLGNAALAPWGRHLKQYTQTVLKLSPKPESPAPAKSTGPHPVPLKAGQVSPIRHVLFIMKENRTYDQVLGDLPQGNGDKSLCLFPERITPNHHKLAREFTLFDNFYVNADVSAEGWLWTSAAIVPHFNMRQWPAAYAARSRPQGNQDSDPTLVPTAGYLWTEALKKGLSFRNYGFFVVNRKDARPSGEVLASTSDPALEPHSNRFYAGYDPGFPDVERAAVFLKDLQEFERTGTMPRLMTMVLPNDHTFGTAPGKLTPYSSMADNDLAFGRIVEALSKSRFWPHLAIFVVEDDAQNGPDHVDSHRAPAYVISPYTRRGFVDSTFYNTTSVLRTIEMILGLSPMTQYDATASPILAAFQSKPDLRPYRAAPANISLTEKNPARSTTAAASLQLDFSAPDRADDLELNRVLWKALRDAEPPAPTRGAFLRYRGESEDE